MTITDTGFDLLAGMNIKDVYLHMTTGSSGSTAYVGVSDTTDGFLALATVTATGYKIYDNPVITGTAANSVNATQIRGALVAAFGTGAATDTAGAYKGWFCTKKYAVTAATSLVYANGTTNTLASGAGYIYVVYDLSPTQGN